MLIKSIPDDLLFVLIFIALTFIFTRVFNITVGNIFALMVAAFLIYNLKNYSDQSSLDQNMELEYKLKMIGEPEFFYKEPDLIILFYDVLDFANLNKDSFDKSISAANSLLSIENDFDTLITPKTCAYDWKNAYSFMIKSLNYFQSLVYSIPKNKIIQQKLHDRLGQLHQILYNHLEQMKKTCNLSISKTGINRSTHIIPNDLTHKNDPNHDSNFSYFV